MKKKLLALALSMVNIWSFLVPVSVFAEEEKGDVNLDGKFNTEDVVLLQNWLSGMEGATLSEWENADFDENAQINIFDLCLMKKKLLEKGYSLAYQAVTDQIYAGNKEKIDTDEDHSVMIYSTEELKNYLSAFFEEKIVGKFLEIYDEHYFEEQGLLLNIFWQNSGTMPLLHVNDVTRSLGNVQIIAEWENADSAELNGEESALLVQVSLPKKIIQQNSIEWKILQDAPEIRVPDAYQIEVKNILQNPELPTGCETVALTILLNHLGCPVNKLTLARDYLPKMEFYWRNGILYGADFRTTFAGNPENSYSYGCYAPCITTTANEYFRDNAINGQAFDITGTDFDTLLKEYIAQDIPVLIWITSQNLHETKLTSIWTTPEGNQVQWVAYEHCVVLTGYDHDQQLIYVSDPLTGNVAYDEGKLRQRYIDLGQQAVYINMQ